MQNGYFQLVNAPGGYGLQIFQPKDGGADVNLQEVLNYLERESVPYDPMAIKKAILSGEDTVCFLERKDCPALEETYSIEVSQDNMQVILRFYPASQSGKRTTMDSVIQVSQIPERCLRNTDERSAGSFYVGWDLWYRSDRGQRKRTEAWYGCVCQVLF